MVKLLKSVKVYILFGYITLAMIASVTVWVIYSETLELYENQIDMNPVSNRVFIANSILTNLYEAEGLERSYLQTSNPNHYEAYNILMDSISRQINMLGLIESNLPQQIHTDSIQKLLTRKRENLNEINSLKNSGSTEKLYDRALHRLAENKDSLSQLFSAYSSAHTVKDSVLTKHRKSRLYEQLIHVFAPPEETGLVLNETSPHPLQNDNILNTINPTDSIEQLLTSIIEDIRKESAAFEKQLIRKEQENLENAQIISMQIRQILSKLENEELIYSLSRVESQQVHISQMTNIVLILGAAALLVIIFFLILILKDITRSQHYRQNLEKEKAYSESLLKSKEQLMLSITHDLKTPLSSIAGFSQLAARESASSSQTHYLKNIDQSAKYILRLINDLLDFARLETGKLTIENKKLNLATLIEEVVSGFYPQASAKKLNLEYQVNDLAEKEYLTDPVRINQILSNLISNAIKFTNEGQITVIASVFRSKGKTDWIQLEVSDTGIGISKENTQLIFEEFSRISSEDNMQYEGSGLGLTITKRIVELLNGSITLSSELGKGSCFVVMLPLIRYKAREPQTELPQNPDKKITFNKERVLLVDDDPFLLELTTRILHEANLQVLYCSRSEDAINAWKNQPFDILITDVQMPEMNGIELLSFLREFHSKSIRSIAVTGEVNGQNDYTKAGFSAVLQKPVQPDDLLETVSAVLAKENAETTATNHNGIEYEKSIYSIEGIKAFTGGEPETTREILISFTNSTVQNIEEFRRNLQQNNYDEISNLAHKMLPMFRQLEATEVIGPLKILERYPFPENEPDRINAISNLVLIKIENLMENLIEDYQLPFSGKLIS
jgi:signal transduction histidine kinase/DNA-binding response OmpR family regulator